MTGSGEQHGSEDKRVHAILPAPRNAPGRDDAGLRLLIPFVPAEAGTQFLGGVLGPWIPAFAGMNGDWLNCGANLNSLRSNPGTQRPATFSGRRADIVWAARRRRRAPERRARPNAERRERQTRA